MRINIKSDKVELNDSLREWIYKKLGEIDKVLPDFTQEEISGGKDSLELNIEIGKTTKHHLKGEVFKAEIQLYLPKQLLRVRAKDRDLRIAIDKARDDLYRKIKKYKRRRIARARKWARKLKEVARVHRVILNKDRKLLKIFRSLKRK